MCGCFRSFQLHHRFSTTMGNWGRKAVKSGMTHIAGIPSSSFVVGGEVFLVSQQVIELLGANFNKPSFNTSALKYKTKRCGTVRFNLTSNCSKSKQSSTDVTCILKAWTNHFCSVISTSVLWCLHLWTSKTLDWRLLTSEGTGQRKWIMAVED